MALDVWVHPYVPGLRGAALSGLSRSYFLRNPNFNLLPTQTPSPWVCAPQAGVAGVLKHPRPGKIAAPVFPSPAARGRFAQ